MAVYRCSSCGATTDTEATARALRESLGYGPGTEIALTAPQKCDVCGSTDIAEVTAEPAVEPTVALPRAEEPRICKRCGAALRGDSLFCHGCGEFDRGQLMTILWVVPLGGGISAFSVWFFLSNAISEQPLWLCAAPFFFLLAVILFHIVKTVLDSARALRSARQGSGRT